MRKHESLERAGRMEAGREGLRAFVGCCWGLEVRQYCKRLPPVSAAEANL